MTGSRGESQAQVLFTNIGWAPPVKLSEDIGTDLVTFARTRSAPDDTEYAWDLGAPVFMQVKASPTEYLTPTSTNDGQHGWWFAESDTYHFDHWLSFGLPYLLVLVDVQNQIAYWAEVNGDAIVATGKGRKIFVPFTQTVDERNVEALNRVATSKRQYNLQGEVWSGILNALAPADRLRNAMIIPRMIAPHPNRVAKEICFEEAVAMILRNRYYELVHRARKGHCPRVEDWNSHKEWGWRFVGAVHTLVTTGSNDHFDQLNKGARHRFERDACLVVQACVAYQNEQIEEAAKALEPSRASRPADRSWLLAHKSAFLFEMDKPEKAVTTAQKALIATNSLDGDLSASAIRSVAVSVLYAVGGATGDDLEAAVTAQDHVANWWRDQEVKRALERDLKLRFENWTGANTVHFVASTPQDDLANIEWTAAFSGAWNSWRQIKATTAKLTLTSPHSSKDFETALRSLIFVGDIKSTKYATRKIWLDGPSSALSSLATDSVTRIWTKRDEGATLAFLAQAGDFLSEDTADDVVQRILHLLKRDGHVRTHGKAWSHRFDEAAKALTRLLKSASTSSHNSIADLIAEDFATSDDSDSPSYIRLARALAFTDMDDSRINSLCIAACSRTDHHRIPILEFLGPFSSRAIHELQQEANAGNLSAIRSVLVAGATDPNSYLTFGKNAAHLVQSMVDDARGANGTSSFKNYENDPLDDLVLAALNTNSSELWHSIINALEECVIAESQQQRSIRRLATHFQNLPPFVRAKLKDIAPSLHGTHLPFATGSAHEFSGAVDQLRIAAGIISDLDIETRLFNKQREDPLSFVQTLAAWKSKRRFPFLATSVIDENPNVRAHAAYNLIQHAHQYPDDLERTKAVIETAMLRNNGCALSNGIAQGLAEYPGSEFSELEESIRSHPSAVVRAHLLAKD